MSWLAGIMSLQSGMFIRAFKSPFRAFSCFSWKFLCPPQVIPVSMLVSDIYARGKFAGLGQFKGLNAIRFRVCGAKSQVDHFWLQNH